MEEDSNKNVISQRNKLINNIIQLYYYYNFINQKLNEKTYCEFDSHNYCLVNSEWMKILKNIYHYELIVDEFNSNNEIKNLFNKNKYNNNFDLKELNDIEEIIKKISPNTLTKFNFNNVNEIKNFIHEPDFITIQNNEYKNLLVLNKFEIINKKVLELFINENIHYNDSIFTNCFSVDNYIIINYRYTMEDRYITCIGKLNQFIFNVNYILIYNNEYYRENHIKKIRQNKLDFLINYQSFNFFEPILDENGDEVEVIAGIINYKEEDYSSLDNKITQQKENNSFNYISKEDNNNYNLNNQNEINMKEEINILKQQLNNEKIKNKNLMEKIEFLKNELKEEKLNNKKLENMYNNLRNELIDEIKKYNDLKENFEQKLLKNINKKCINDLLLNNLLEKDKEIRTRSKASPPRKWRSRTPCLRNS